MQVLFCVSLSKDVFPDWLSFLLVLTFGVTLGLLIPRLFDMISKKADAAQESASKAKDAAQDAHDMMESWEKNREMERDIQYLKGQSDAIQKMISGVYNAVLEITRDHAESERRKIQRMRREAPPASEASHASTSFGASTDHNPTDHAQKK